MHRHVNVSLFRTRYKKHAFLLSRSLQYDYKRISVTFALAKYYEGDVSILLSNVVHYSSYTD